jgi:hypothetical protein
MLSPVTLYVYAVPGTAVVSSYVVSSVVAMVVQTPLPTTVRWMT